MTTGALAAFGTLLKAGDGASPEVFTTIAEVLSISGPSLSAQTIDVTNHSSPSAWREFIIALLDAGEVSFDINFIPTNATQSYSTGALHDFVNRTKRNFKIVFTDGGSTTWAFSGYYTKFDCSEPVDGKIGASLTIKVVGQPTLAG